MNPLANYTLDIMVDFPYQSQPTQTGGIPDAQVVEGWRPVTGSAQQAPFLHRTTAQGKDGKIKYKESKPL